MHITPEDIKKFRSENHLTQQQMADLAGIAREMVNKIESGKLPISRGNRIIFEKLISEKKSLQDVHERLKTSSENFTQSRLGSLHELSKQQSDAISLLTSSSSWVSVYLLCKLVAKQEDRPLKEVLNEARQLAQNRRRTLEETLIGLDSFDLVP